MDIHQFMDLQSAKWRSERSESQMTLGELILTLKRFDPLKKIKGLSGEVFSYRGYYSDLAIKSSDEVQVSTLLDVLQKILNTELTGYKGGEFMMHKNVPVWITECSSMCGQKLIGFDETTHSIITKEDEN